MTGAFKVTLHTYYFMKQTLYLGKNYLTIAILEPAETSGLFVDQPIGIGTRDGVCDIARDIHLL